MKYKVIFIFFIIFSCLCCMQISGEDKIISVINDNSELVSVGFLNTNIKGKIEIENTNIKDYIVQTRDNDYYKNHDYNGNDKETGAIYIDYRNSMNNNIIVLYGSNAKYGESPFYDIDEFLNVDYMMEHNKIKVELNDVKKEYEIYDVLKVEEHYDTYNAFVPKSENLLIIEASNEEVPEKIVVCSKLVK